jgi:hypothetical protein
MTTTTLNGTIVRVHEIANAAKPILDSSRRDTLMWKSREADASMNPLSYVLQHTQIMARDRKRRSAPGEKRHVVVLRGDDAIRVVKYSS